MKTIGVLGGLGPQATTDFIDRIHTVSQKIIPQQESSGYPPMVVYYCTFAPILFENGKPVLPIQPEPRLLQATQQLGEIADFLVMPSNTPHIFQPQIEEVSGCRVISMIDATLAEVEKRQLQKVGILGFKAPREYASALDELGIDYIMNNNEIMGKLRKAIFAVMEGRAGKEEASLAKDGVRALRDEGVGGVILGCSELPLLLLEELDAPDIINPAQLLAEAAVDYSLQ